MRTRVPVVPIAVAALLLHAPVAAQNALALFHKMQDALGGADRIAAIRDYEEIVRAESWNGNTGQSMGEVRKRTRWIRPDILRIDQVGPGSTYVLYFDGASGWEILPGTKDAIPLAGGELEFAKGYIRGFKLNTWLADRNPKMTITSPAPNVVRVSDGDPEHQNDITLDPASFLPVKIEQTSLSDPARPTPSHEQAMEWETVQGIKFQRGWTVYRSGVKVAAALDARHTINTGLKQADLAAKPADSRPVLPR
jgi:hypothetical protein